MYRNLSSDVSVPSISLEMLFIRFYFFTNFYKFIVNSFKLVGALVIRLRNNFGVTAGVNRDTADLWHWESGSSSKSGDDILVRGKDNVSWDVSLGWDLGDLVWNDAQTSIDVRSRLAVQLRNDILDEVNKYYFERIRIKIELDNLSLEERKKRFEKELRLQELTASLDALTGGYLSRQLK